MSDQEAVENEAAEQMAELRKGFQQEARELKSAYEKMKKAVADLEKAADKA